VTPPSGPGSGASSASAVPQASGGSTSPVTDRGSRGASGTPLSTPGGSQR
jgi:hypothetical protein